MKNDPDNRTEQWLQAYAQRRREQAGREVELHEATRRMLLDESRREWNDAAAPESETAPAKESVFSWAWIGAVAAGVMLVAVISKNGSQGDPTDRPIKITKNIPGSGDGNRVEQERASTPPADRPMKIAKNIPGTGDGNLEDQKRASTPPAEKAILSGKKDQAGNADTSSAVAKATPSSASVVSSAPRPLALSDNADAVGSASRIAPATVSGVRLAKTFQAVPKVQVSANFYSGPARLRQDFAPNTRRTVTRRAAPAIAAKTPHPVLQNFQFERDGVNILVVDHDGSEYRGTVRALEKADLAGRDLPADKETKEEGKAARSKNPVPPTRPGSSTATEFFFQVAGTNRTLKQQVVFQGNILNELTMKPKLSVESSTLKVPIRAKKQSVEQKKTEDQPRLRIQGHAQVGKLQYDVDARNVPSPRPSKQGSPAKPDKDGHRLPEK